MTCLYMGGEEVSWGQHIFYLEEIGHVTDVNKSGEFGIHNAYESFEKVPRAILQFAVIAGGLLVPIWCAFAPRWRASRFALFLPSAIIVPAALGVVLFWPRPRPFNWRDGRARRSSSIFTFTSWPI